MNRILTVFFVLLAATVVADYSQAQGPYGSGPYGPAPSYGQARGYSPAPAAYNPYGVPPQANPYGVPPQAAAGYPPGGYAPAGYAPAGYGAPSMAPPQAGPMPGYQGQGGYMPAAYSQPGPSPTPAGGGYGAPPPGYSDPSYGDPSYQGAPGYVDQGPSGPIYSDPSYVGGEFSGGACSSCGANCGACDCGAFGLGSCGTPWQYNPLRQVFGGLEILSWYRNGTNLPPLVTTSPQGTAQEDAGVLGLPTTRSLLGGGERIEDDLGGVRFTVGTWFDQAKEYGLVYRLTAVGDDGFDFNLSSNGSGVPTIARPYFDTDLDDQNALLVAFNDPVNGTYATGNINVNLKNEITNNDLYATLMISKGCGWRTDFLFGYQNTSIDETLGVQSFTTVVDPQFANNLFAAGTTIDVRDQFSVQNEFNGGLLGLQSELQHGPWSFRFLGKFAVGGTTSTATISGRTITTSPTTPPTVSQTEGGLLTQPTNVGSFEAESTTISPEATMTVGYCCTQNLRLTAGYSFLYWTHIVPTNALLDTTVNPSQVGAFGGGALTGDPRPAPIISGDTDYWVMGLNLGAEYRY